MALTGTRVTCVKNSTNVQILTQKALTDELEAEILANCNGQNSVEELGTHVNLRYWYKSTNTHAEGAAR
jgi:hypothetical protein